MATTSISLLERLRQSEAQEQDWSRFAALYTPLLFFWAEKRAGLSRSEAEDLVQEVMVLLMDKLPEFSYDSQKSFRAWLRTVTMNRSRDYLRKKRRQERNAESGELRNANAADDIEFLTAQEYQAHLAHRALELMKIEFEESTWRACWMHVVENRSAKEISAELGITPNAVYLAKARVLRRLREELGPMWEN